MSKLLITLAFALNFIHAYGQLVISRIETDDKKNITVEFQGNPPVYAFLEEENELFYPNEKNQLVLPINRERILEDNGPIIFTYFRILNANTDVYVGEIEFRFTPGDVFKYQGEYVSISKNSFLFPRSKDVNFPQARPTISESEFDKLLKMISSWNSRAAFIIRSPKSDIIERCSLIIQFVWSLDPISSFAPPHIDQLSVTEILEGLKKNELGIICGHHSKLFMNLAVHLMPDVRIRQTSCYECRSELISRNIHVGGHAFVEVYENGKWIYIDPHLRLYFKDKSGNLLGAHDLRKLIKANRYHECIFHHIPTIIPTNYDIYDLYSIPRYFNWFYIREVKK